MSSNLNGTHISRQNITLCQEIVQNLKVPELHQLLAIFNYPKIGKKQELVDRALSLLSNPRYQAKAVQKVFELQTNNRTREAMNPYPTANNRTASSSGGSLHGQQLPPISYGASLPPTCSSGSIHPASAAAAAAGMARTSSYPTVNHLIAANMALAAASYTHQNFQQAPLLPNFSQPNAMTTSQQSHIQAPPTHHQQAPPTVVPMQQSGQVRNLRIVELPFYDHIKVIVPMTELPSFAVPTRPGEGRYHHHFGVPKEDLTKVHYRSEEQPLPRFELQLRMFLLETSEEQQDAFPPGSVVRLDDYQVSLPAIIPTNKPNAEQKRYPRPVNITPYMQPPRDHNRPHRLNFEWNGDKRAWAFTITLVRRLNSNILLDRILGNTNARRPFDRTKQTIIRRLNGTDEDDVQMDSLKISLLDPLMRTRIKIPSRAADCTHLQSFDLFNYLMMCEKRPTWKCPVCDKNAIYSKLIIDEYFQQLLSNVGASVDEVELLKDGSWRVPHENNTLSLDSDEDGQQQNGAEDEGDDDIMVVTVPTGKKRTEHLQQQPATSASVPKRPSPASEIDVICLSSDDDDESDEQLAHAIAASRMSGSEAPSGSGTPTTMVQNIGQAATETVGGGKATNGAGNAAGSGAKSNDSSWPANSVLYASNGTHQNIFRPIMDDAAKVHVAQNLAIFLQSVCAKNAQFHS